MAKDPTLKKKRKSEAVAMEVDAPVEGTASAVAVVADVSVALELQPRAYVRNGKFPKLTIGVVPFLSIRPDPYNPLMHEQYDN